MLQWRDSPSYFIVNGDKIDNKEDIAKNFNSFFHNIDPTFSEKSLQYNNKTIKQS